MVQIHQPLQQCQIKTKLIPITIISYLYDGNDFRSCRNGIGINALALYVMKYRSYAIHHFSVLVHSVSLDGHLDPHLVGHIRGVARGTDEVAVEVEQGGVLAARAELIRRRRDDVLHMGKHLVEEGLKGVRGVVLSRPCNGEDDVVETAPRKQSRETRACNHQLLEGVGVTDTPSCPRDVLVLGLKKGEHSESLDGSIVEMRKVGSFHDLQTTTPHNHEQGEKFPFLGMGALTAVRSARKSGSDNAAK